MSKVDELEMYEVSGDIVGGVGNFVTRLNDINERVEKAIKACKKLKELEKLTALETKTSDDGKYTIFKEWKCSISVPLGALEQSERDIKECIGEVEKLRDDANECEYIADSIRNYRKKIEKDLSPTDRAKFWSSLSLATDMYAAKRGDTVSISDDPDSWDGVITFKRMENGTYQVIKNGVVMGYTTADGKKKYYENLSKLDSYQKQKSTLRNGDATNHYRDGYDDNTNDVISPDQRRGGHDEMEYDGNTKKVISPDQRRGGHDEMEYDGNTKKVKGTHSAKTTDDNVTGETNKKSKIVDDFIVKQNEDKKYLEKIDNNNLPDGVKYDSYNKRYYDEEDVTKSYTFKEVYDMQHK